MTMARSSFFVARKTETAAQDAANFNRPHCDIALLRRLSQFLNQLKIRFAPALLQRIGSADQQRFERSRRGRECGHVSAYLLCDPLPILPSPEGNMESPWKVLIEVPSHDPDTFLSAARLTSLEAVRVRLGDGFYAGAMRNLKL
jgi:hypothetical protein